MLKTIHSEIELQQYLHKFYNEHDLDSDEWAYFLFKTGERTFPLAFCKHENYYLAVDAEVTWYSIHNDDELKEYVRDRYIPEAFEEMYQDKKKMMREKGLAVISGWYAVDQPSYPCEIIGTLSKYEFVDWDIEEQTEKEKNREKIDELEKLCFEYPPDLKRIDTVLGQVTDFSPFYYFNLRFDYVMDNADFLGWFLSEYFKKINVKWFGEYVINEETKEFEYIKPDILPELKRETYAPKIVSLFLKHGYNLNYLSGLVGASCLNALVYSYFNDELCTVAKLLIKNGADPTIGDEEGLNAIDTIEDSYLGKRDIRGCLEDDYLDNLNASYKYAKICKTAAKKIYARSYPVHEPWFQELYPTLANGFDELDDCPRCGCQGEDACVYINGSMAYLICGKCGFYIQNVTTDREHCDVFDFLADHWNAFDE